jgi:hypothetical protein
MLYKKIEFFKVGDLSITRLNAEQALYRPHQSSEYCIYCPLDSEISTGTMLRQSKRAKVELEAFG